MNNTLSFKTYALSIIFSITCYINLSAQDPTTSTLDTASVSRDIQIEKDYIPEIKETKRPHIELKAREPEKASKNDVVYSKQEHYITPKSIFNPLPQSDLRVLKRGKTDDGFAQAAFGFPFNWDAEIFYPIINKRNTTLLLNGVHNGILTNKKFLDTDVALDFEHKINRKSKIIASLNYENQHFNYYGIDSMNIDTTSFYKINDNILRGDSILPNNQTIHSIYANVGLFNTKQNANLHYEAMLNYKFTYFNSNGLSENIINANGGISKTFINIHSLNIYADVNATMYNNPLNILPIASKSNTVVGIYPSYSLKMKNINFKAGAKIFISTLNKTNVVGSPDVHMTYAYKSLLYINIGIDGEYRINNLSSIIKENRYFNANNTIGENTHTPFNFYANANIKPIKGLLLNFHTKYSIIKDQYFFNNENFNQITNPSLWETSGTKSLYSNLFSAELTNVNLFNIGFTVNYNIQDKYIAFLNFNYNHWDSKIDSIQAWNKPTFQVSLGARAEIISNLFVNLNFNFESGRKYKIIGENSVDYNIYKFNNIYDLNFSTYYTILDKYTVFVKINNILGNIPSIRYSQWNGYEDIGCNVLFGFNLSF